MSRRRFAGLFLSLLVMGVLWPAVAGVLSCGDGHGALRRALAPPGKALAATGGALCEAWLGLNFTG
jgi:hypothetical protein